MLTITRIPAFFVFSLSDLVGNIKLENSEIYPVEGNIIDVVALADRDIFVYSMDCIHKPFCTVHLATDDDQNIRPCMGCLQYDAQRNGLEASSILHNELFSEMEACARSQAVVEQKNAAKGRSLRELLYSLESLRKRGGDDIVE